MSLWRRARPITFVNARVVGIAGITAASLRVVGGRVAEMGGQPAQGDAVADLDGDFIFPGLINAHDHLELNNFPRLKWHDRYVNAREWIADFQPRFGREPALIEAMAVGLDDRLLIGGLKNLLSGVTTVCQHNPRYPFLGRSGYPVHVVGRYRWSHSLLLDGDQAVARAYRSTPAGWPWIIHAAEGTDAEAAAELGRLDRLGCVGANSVLVHGVGLGREDRARLLERGAGLIWCPASNQFMLGATAEVGELARAGRVALGSDSRLSGSRDLLEELSCAAGTGQSAPVALFRMVTTDAAALLRRPESGRLAPGLPADLMVLRASSADPFEALLSAARHHVRLVMVAGRPRIGEDSLRPVFEAAGVAVRAARVDGRDSWLAETLASRLRRAACGEPGLELAG